MNTRPGIFRSWRGWIGPALAGTIMWGLLLALPVALEGQEADTLPTYVQDSPVYYSHEFVEYDSAAVHDGLLPGQGESCREYSDPDWCLQIARATSKGYRAGQEDLRSLIRGNSLHLDSLAAAHGLQRVRCDRIFPERGDGAVGCLIARVQVLASEKDGPP